MITKECGVLIGTAMPVTTCCNLLMIQARASLEKATCDNGTLTAVPTVLHDNGLIKSLT